MNSGRRWPLNYTGEAVHGQSFGESILDGAVVSRGQDTAGGGALGCPMGGGSPGCPAEDYILKALEGWLCAQRHNKVSP